MSRQKRYTPTTGARETGVTASEIAAMSDGEWAAEYAFDPDDDTLGERIGSLLGSDDGRFTHASAHLPDLRAYVATRR